MSVDRERSAITMWGWRLGRVAVCACLAVFLMTTVGCGWMWGWLFKKQEKPMEVTVTFVGSDSLNFDGREFQAVHVKAYLLKSTERFLRIDPRAFFSADRGGRYIEQFSREDVWDSASYVIAPGEDSYPPLTMEVTFGRSKDEKVFFGAVANFARTPRRAGGERVTFEMRKKPRQDVWIELGPDGVVKGKKRKKK